MPWACLLLEAGWVAALLPAPAPGALYDAEPVHPAAAWLVRWLLFRLMIGFGKLKFTVAHHGSGLPDGADGGAPAGFLIEAEGKRIYIAGDTALTMDMQLLGTGLDLVILPIGDNFTMGPDDALQAVQWLAPRHVVPCHFDTWPPIAQDGAGWKTRVEGAVPGTSVHLLAPGEGFTLDG